MDIKIGGEWLITLLTCIFVIAKLWDKITWSWWIVLSPLWISGIIAIIVLIIWGVIVWYGR